jgi:hypothetical protein
VAAAVATVAAAVAAAVVVVLAMDVLQVVRLVLAMEVLQVVRLVLSPSLRHWKPSFYRARPTQAASTLAVNGTFAVNAVRKDVHKAQAGLTSCRLTSCSSPVLSWRVESRLTNATPTAGIKKSYRLVLVGIKRLLVVVVLMVLLLVMVVMRAHSALVMLAMRAHSALVPLRLFPTRRGVSLG